MSDDALRITDRVSIPRSELEVRATRSGGPGGQHVNTSSTRIELRWNLLNSVALDDGERARVAAKLAGRLDGDGFLRVVSSATRSQRRNRDAAEDRLADLLRRALATPRKRVSTKPGRAAKEARLDAKKRRGKRKKERGGVGMEE
ncbi:MAG: aminoacyl-tRNA hydrolase [Gemmatimonadaceae bacterium]|nr:aminoacyl-tRNA hydrolase [Gemmatimonadaceae bacterium]MDQ3517891.1 aminoacyl-tRNA hydrolase [Gemmatimonadota bacterium]